MTTSHHVQVIDEHPVPLKAEQAKQLQENNPTFTGLHDGEILHPDELHERYVEILSENHEWRIFRVHIYGFESNVFVWNHQLGFGIRIDDMEGQFDVLQEAIAAVNQETDNE